MTDRRPDVIIVGAGIVGAACALALAREHLRVLVIDAEFPGGGSTAAAMGHLVVMDDSPAQLALTAYSRDLWNALADEMPPDCEFEMRGTLWIAEGEAEMAAARAKQDVYTRHGVAASLVASSELAAMEPHLRSGLAGALFVPDDAVLYPPAAARWMLARAVAIGAEVRDGCTAESVEAGAVRVREHGAVSTISAAEVVVAAGLDTNRLVPGLPIVPRKGHLLITDRYPGLCRSQLVELGYLRSAHTFAGESVAFNVQPRSTGQLLIGSSRELVDRDAAINARVLADMVRRAIAFLPALGRCSAIRAWTGFRPATPDKLPLIGCVDARGAARLWVAAGHEGLGITMAPGTAELIASGITGRSTRVDATPFLPQRAMPALHAAEA